MRWTGFSGKRAAVFVMVLGLIVCSLTGCGQQKLVGSDSAVAEADTSSTICSQYADVKPKFVFTYAENQTANYPTSLAACQFAYRVHERTKGAIQIRVYTDAELGDETDMYKEVMYGGVDFMRASLSGLTQYNDVISVVVMPYLFQDSEHMWDVLDGEIGKELMDSFQGTGMVALSWYDSGARSFYLREPVYTLEDMKNKVIRIQDSVIMEDMVELLGGRSVALEYDEVYSALQVGKVDAAENNFPSYESKYHNQVAPYYLLDEHTRIPEMQLMSQASYDRLTEEEKQIILECAQESAIYERQLWAEWEETAKNKVIEEGCEIITLSEEELEKFKEAVQPVYETYCRDYMDIIDRIRAEAK
ncbi:MAG: TRAP transporter substrate-binding protein [Lachnospiraceae bacterium]|nr:TRAP transporter substrate-binding protein [Lachnospiraceae bacterium]